MPFSLLALSAQWAFPFSLKVFTFLTHPSFCSVRRKNDGFLSLWHALTPIFAVRSQTLKILRSRWINWWIFQMFTSCDQMRADVKLRSSFYRMSHYFWVINPKHTANFKFLALKSWHHVKVKIWGFLRHLGTFFKCLTFTQCDINIFVENE